MLVNFENCLIGGVVEAEIRKENVDRIEELRRDRIVLGVLLILLALLLILLAVLH
jgi:hypothetical protein